MIKMENVTMKYPTGTVALKDVNIQIEKGEFVFVVGSSGSGKTTFIELLLRELVPTKGRITVAGYDYSRLKKNRIHKPRRKIGVVFQNFRLLKDRTVYENVAFAQRVIETPSRYIRRQVPAVLALVGLVLGHIRDSSRVVSSRGLRSRELSSTSLISSSQMSLQVTSTLRTHGIS